MSDTQVEALHIQRRDEELHLLNDHWPLRVEVDDGLWDFAEEKFIYRVGDLMYVDLHNAVAEYVRVRERPDFRLTEYALVDGWRAEASR